MVINDQPSFFALCFIAMEPRCKLALHGGASRLELPHEASCHALPCTAALTCHVELSLHRKDIEMRVEMLTRRHNGRVHTVQ